MSDPEAPPVGEELHLPSPSLVPILNAVGVVLALLGLTIWRGLLVVGLLLFAFTLVRWIRDVTRDIGELPADHRAGH
jgi:hypothetical protein